MSLSKRYQSSRTTEEQVVWDRFMRRLDYRYLNISPPGVVLRCSVSSAKRIAREVLHTLAIGEAVRVVGAEGTIWYQIKREEQ